MTAKTFFNKGIYSATLKRFWVGSALYLVIMLLISSPWDTDYTSSRYYFDTLANMNYILSLFVPVVVATLVYKFVHSKKNSIFIHSMPATRCANYVSTILAAFTLMGVPVLIQCCTLILATGRVHYSFMWFVYVMFCNLVLFSIATFAAMLTGASWVGVVLYAASHFVGYIFGMFTESLMETFAAGYSFTSDFPDMVSISVPELLGVLCEFNERVNFVDWRKKTMLVLALVSVVLYALSWLLYKKRRMERCEDASGYKTFNYILKYAVTLFAAMLSFEIFKEYLDESIAVFVIGMTTLTAVAYFASEMVLRKKIRIFAASFKGYLAFAAVFTAVLTFFATTSIFGFETFVPDKEDIVDAFISSNASGVESISDEDDIESLINFHREVIAEERKELVKQWDGHPVWVYYETLDGKKYERRYFIDTDKMTNVMNTLYESESFKRDYERIFSIDEDTVTDIQLVNTSGVKIDTNVSDDLKGELINCIRKDILQSTYSELYLASSTDFGNIKIRFIEVVDEDEKTFIMYDDVPSGYTKSTITYRLNANFENTIKFLDENGYDYKIK